MPEFSTAFSGLSEKRTLTHEELVRSIRFMIAAVRGYSTLHSTRRINE